MTTATKIKLVMGTIQVLACVGYLVCWFCG